MKIRGYPERTSRLKVGPYYVAYLRKVFEPDIWAWLTPVFWVFAMGMFGYFFVDTFNNKEWSLSVVLGILILVGFVLFIRTYLYLPVWHYRRGERIRLGKLKDDSSTDLRELCLQLRYLIPSGNDSEIEAVARKLLERIVLAWYSGVPAQAVLSVLRTHSSYTTQYGGKHSVELSTEGAMNPTVMKLTWTPSSIGALSEVTRKLR